MLLILDVVLVYRQKPIKSIYRHSNVKPSTLPSFSSSSSFQWVISMDFVFDLQQR
jgi:hypothetical protein